MAFGRRLSAPTSPVKSAPTVPVLVDAPTHRAWTGESPQARLVRAYAPRPVRPAFFSLILVLLSPFIALAAAPSFALVYVDAAGDAYVMDSGLSASDCESDYRAALAGFSCELESNQ